MSLRPDVKKSGKLVPPTPQSLLDDAVYNLLQNNGVVASECLWLSASLCLKNFAFNNKFDTKTHSAKTRTVEFLKKEFPKHRAILRTSWDGLRT